MSNHQKSLARQWLAKVQRIGVLLINWPRYTAYRRAFLGTPYAEAAASTGLLHVYLRKFTAPYLSRNFSGPERLLQLDHHCRFINDHFPRELFDRLHRGALPFAVRAEEGQQGEFRLDLPVRTHVDGSPCWEGDLILEYWFQERLLHRMTFSVLSSKPFDDRDEVVLFIGGSQSYGDRELRREASLFNRQINAATATLIGLKAVAEALDISKIYAVKTLNQITLHLRPGDPGSAYETFGRRIMGKIGVRSLSYRYRQVQRETRQCQEVMAREPAASDWIGNCSRILWKPNSGR